MSLSCGHGLRLKPMLVVGAGGSGGESVGNDEFFAE